MRIRLSTKIWMTITGVVALTALASTIAVLAAWDVERVLWETQAEHVPSVQMAGELEAALLQEQGFLRAYLLDNGNAQWLGEIRKAEAEFFRATEDVRTTTHMSDAENEILDRITTTYQELVVKRDQAIALHEAGRVEEAKKLLLRDISERLDRTAFDLCEEFIAASNQDVLAQAEDASVRVRRATWLAAATVGLTCLLGGAMLWYYYRDIVHPLRGMVADARVLRGNEQGGRESPQDEIREVGDYLRDLMSDMADAQSRLEKRRAHLAHAEKLASVGKLAASVAHEIRNPLTAVKMWLFSIHEAVKADPELDQKCTVVVEEITRLETIVRSFLEFSRPPTPDFRPQEIEAVVERTLQIVGPRLNERKIRVVCESRHAIPRVQIDAERIKHVLVNLLNNAAEAMEAGGTVWIRHSVENDPDGTPMVVTRICDDGPGMPEKVRLRIFEPFFSTKEDGTGLGLCIAAQIVARHGGRLVLESSTPQGTVFALWTPIADPSS